MLRKWHSPAQKIHQVVVAREEGDDVVEPPEHLHLNRDNFTPSPDMQVMLDNVLGKFAHMIGSTTHKSKN